MHYAPDVVVRFWPKVNVPKHINGMVDENACWLWTSYTRTGRMGSGLTYGRIKVKVGGVWKHIAAHRLAYELTYGLVPEGKCVLHTCDVPLCCNPNHLFIGTVDDNNKDRVEKGRSSMGEAHPKAVLTEERVIEIVKLTKEGWTQRALAEKFNVGKRSIQNILEGKGWKHITGIERRESGSGKGTDHVQAKVTPDQVREIRRLFDECHNLNQVGLKFGISRATVRDIVLRRTWKHVE
jgi:hypothetical protein